MSDKVYIVVLILLAAIGLYSYQTALENQDGSSLLSSILKERGIDESMDPADVALKNFGLAQNVQKLSEMAEKILRTKQELMQVHGKYLSDLTSSYVSLRLVVEQYKYQLTSEHNRFMNNADKLNGLLDEVEKSTKYADLGSQITVFEKVQEKFMDEINQVIKDAQGEIEVSNQALIEIAEMMENPSQLQSWGCLDIASCVNQNLEIIRAQIKYYEERAMIFPSLQLAKMIDLVETIEYELNFFNENTRSAEQQFTQSSQIIYDKINSIYESKEAQDMNIFQNILKNQERLRLEQRKIKQNLEDHIRHLKKRHKEAVDIMEQIVNALSESDLYDFSVMKEKYQTSRDLVDTSLNAVVANLISITQVLEDRLYVNDQFIAMLARKYKIDLSALKEQLGIQEVITEALFHKNYQDDKQQLGPLQGRALNEQKTLKTMREVYGP